MHFSTQRSTAEASDATVGRRGRPSVIDREAVAAVALELWHARGLAETSWAEIADAAGVSLRTLRRHFSSKDDFAWVGVPAATARLKAALAATAPGEGTNAALRRSALFSLTGLANRSEIGPHWVHAVAAEPSLRASSAAAYRSWTEALSAFVLTRHPGTPVAVVHGIAAAYRVAMLETLTEWADEGSVGDPARLVDEALGHLAFTFPNVETTPNRRTSQP